MNLSWKPSVMKVHCEALQFWLCGLKTYLPPKLPEYAIGGPNRFQGLSHRDQYAADLQEAGRRSLQEQEGPRPGCSHWDPTTLAQAPSPTTPSTAALPGSTSQQQAALAPASGHPKLLRPSSVFWRGWRTSSTTYWERWRCWRWWWQALTSLKPTRRRRWLW